MILEGEKSVDAARSLVEATEAKQLKLRKEEKKIRKRSTLDLNELGDVQSKITKTQNDKDYAESEAVAKTKDHELVKMIRVKEAMGKYCRSQLALSAKSNILFSAGSEIVNQMPELTPESLDDDVLNLKYQGAGKTIQIVLKAKEDLEEKRGDKVVNTLPQSPPSYDEIHRQPPTNPYYPSSPEASFNQSPRGAYPRLDTTL